MHYENTDLRNPDIALGERASDLYIDNAYFEGMITSINSEDCFYIPSLDLNSTHLVAKTDLVLYYTFLYPR